MELARLHTTAEVMEAFGLSRSGLMSLIESGELPAVKVCRQYRFRAEDVEACIAAHAVRPARSLRPVTTTVQRAAS